MEKKEQANGIDDLLIRCFDGTASKDEYDLVYRWTIQSSENREHYRKMFDVLMASDLLRPVDSEMQKRIWLQLEKKIQTPENPKPQIYAALLKWVSVAAIVVVAYMAGIHILYNDHTAKQQVVTTVKGEKSMVELSDGTKVWLNDKTSFTYPETFGKKLRTVELSGEAYFEVAKDTGKPFIVKSGDVSVEVLGTQFNIRASDLEPTITTTLVEGSVKVRKNIRTKENEEITLIPGQQLQFDKQSGSMSLREVNSQLYTAWKEGRISFDQEQIQHIFAFMERNFHITIRLKKQQIAERKYTGRFSLDEKPEKMLTLIQQSIPFNFYIQNDTIHVE